MGWRKATPTLSCAVWGWECAWGKKVMFLEILLGRRVMSGTLRHHLDAGCPHISREERVGDIRQYSVIWPLLFKNVVSTCRPRDGGRE